MRLRHTSKSTGNRLKVVFSDGSLIAAVTTMVLGSTVLAGWWLGECTGFYGTEYGIVLVVLGSIVSLFGVVLWIAGSLNRTDAERQKNEAALRESEARYRIVVEDSPVLICSYLPDGKITFANAAYCNYFGRTFEDITGTNIQSLIPEADREIFMGDIAGLSPDFPTHSHEHRVITPGGDTHWHRWINRALFDEHGRVTRYQVLGVDITERKLDQEALEASEAALRDAQHLAGIGNWEWDLRSNRHTWSREVYRIYGLDPGGPPTGYPEIKQYYTQESWGDLSADVERGMAEGLPYEVDAEVVRADGSHRWITARGEATRDGNGKIISLHGTVQDITDRKNTELALLERDDLLRSMEEVAKVGGWQFDPRTGEGTWTAGVAYIHDLDPCAATDAELGLSFFTGRDRERVDTAVKEAVEQGTAYDLELLMVTALGNRKWVRTIGRPVIKNGTVVQVKGALQDISERKRANEALEASERRYRALFEGAVEGIVVVETESRVFRYVNPAMCRMLGYSNEVFSGLKIDDIHPRESLPEVLAGFEENVRGERTLAQGVPCLHRNGTVIRADILSSTIEIDGLPCLVGFFVDVTERMRLAEEKENLEEQLRQTQKLEAVGQLAGGVAHDFNNLLTGIGGYVGFALEDAEPGSPMHKDLSETMTLVDRAANLVRQLLAFSRKQSLTRSRIDLNRLVRDQLNMLGRLLGEDIDIHFIPGPNLGYAKADPGQISQITMNLAINARDAMPNGGKLTIETGNVELTEEYAAGHQSARAGPHVMVAVSDTGFGMDSQTRQRIFDPFFTTKDLGKGTGLGLSTVYGIVKQHGGNIWVYSEPGRGTTFKIYLPRVTGLLDAVSQPQEEVVGGTETVLLVEDEESVRSVVHRYLENFGYKVLSAANPSEAATVVDAYDDPIHLLLTDVVMPERDGRELYESLLGMRPELRVIFMSGYTDNAILHRGVLNENTPFLEKPFEPNVLAARIRKVLDDET